MKKNNQTSNKQFAALTLAALGVVYGDIGTSPLYALKEVFGGAHNPVPITPKVNKQPLIAVAHIETVSSVIRLQ